MTKIDLFLLTRDASTKYWLLLHFT